MTAVQKRKTAFFATAAVAVCIFVAWRFFFGVHVIVLNMGQAPVDNLTVFVTGNSYNLGTVTSMRQKSVIVEPTGDSHVEIEFSDSNGLKKRYPVDCYFGRGQWNGRVRIELSNDRITHSESKISFLYPYNPFGS